MSRYGPRLVSAGRGRTLERQRADRRGQVALAGGLLDKSTTVLSVHSVFLVRIEHVDKVHQHAAHFAIGFDRFIRDAGYHASPGLADR